MIKIEAKRSEGDTVNTELTINIEGTAIEIGKEAAYILSRLPEQLGREVPDAFVIMKQVFQLEAEILKDRIIREVSDGPRN